ncbi:MAG: chalcone isomerase family protein [Polaromonas sp.]|nr:chalcone isomerase family protein [Polaromonas sp.]
MTYTQRCAMALAGLLISIGAAAAPMDISGIKVADPLDVRGTSLQLNGAGIRYKAIFKVYVAALYTPKKVTTPEQLYADTGVKRMSITLLRDIDSNELGKSFTKAFEENTPRADMVKLIPSLVRMGQIFAAQKKLVAGENFTIDWIPGTGTIITVKGEPQGEAFKEVEFFNALMRIWVGPQPADYKLKGVLLGGN